MKAEIEGICVVWTSGGWFCVVWTGSGAIWTVGVVGADRSRSGGGVERRRSRSGTEPELDGGLRRARRRSPNGIRTGTNGTRTDRSAAPNDADHKLPVCLVPIGVIESPVLVPFGAETGRNEARSNLIQTTPEPPHSRFWGRLDQRSHFGTDSDGKSY